MTRVYLDASALVKLGRREVESDALVEDLERRPGTRLTSVVGGIEFERAMRRVLEDDADGVIEGVLGGVDIIPLNAALAGLASAIGPPELRSLDAVHLATMAYAAGGIDGAYCYDARLAAAARDRGIEVWAPGMT